MNLKATAQPIKKFFGQGVCPYQFSFMLNLSLRKLILSPKKLADRLHLQSNYRVLEIGPGGGYFSVEVARRLPEGHLELLDIQPEMLDKVRKKLLKAGVNNVNFKVADATNLPYENNTFDVVFMVAVLGEIPDKEKCLSSIYRVLRPGGLLSITEQPGDPDLVPLETIKTLAKNAGFELREIFGKRKNFTVNFVKPGK